MQNRYNHVTGELSRAALTLAMFSKLNPISQKDEPKIHLFATHTLSYLIVN